ncbi:anion permease [Thorsellia kenyensis]|uniref:Anion permease n=1 Tax=Thorsellia kenyensis TaxID=1549888 RepID=A0ABV6C8M1_9GAMM
MTNSAPTPKTVHSNQSLKKMVLLALPFIVTLIILLIPVPNGLEPHAWYFFAIFLGVIVGLIFEPLPGAVIGFTGIVVIALFSQWTLFTPEQLADPNFRQANQAFSWAVSGFGNSTVWLIFGAFMFAAGYDKTQFGKRLSLILVKYLGKRSLTLGYAITFADLLLAPFTPSNTARSGGTIYPIIANLPSLYDSKPNDPSARKIGSYLMWVAIAATCVTSSMFLTALAPNLLALPFVSEIANINISWGNWFLAFLPLGVILLLLVPLITYWVYPPEVKFNKEVPLWAAKELEKLGPLSKHEILLILFVFSALFMWIFATSIIEPALAAMLIIVLMLWSGVLNWNDILNNKPAWNTLTWFATLVALASGLTKVGFIAWVGEIGSAVLSGYSPIMSTLLLVTTFYLLHYLFASTTAHTTALLPVFLTVGMAVPGIDMFVLSLMLVTSLGIMGIITPYGTGPSPIYYGSGFLPAKDFWRLGTIFGFIFLIGLIGLGYPWMSFIFQ